MGSSGRASGGGGVLGAPVIAKVADPGADLSTSSATQAEIDSSLRCTVTVPSSGKVLVLHCLVYNQASANNIDLATWVSADGGSTWTKVISEAIGGSTIPAMSVMGTVLLPGLTPGSLTLRMGWSVPAGSNTISIPVHSRGGAIGSVWQMAIPS